MPITNNIDSVTKGSVVLHFGCSNSIKYNEKTHREKIKIFLQLKDEKYKDFKEDLLQKLALTIQLVSGFIVGPLTVIEVFNDPFLNDLADIIINDTTTKLAIFQKNCFSNELRIDDKFRGNDEFRRNGEFIRSVRIWDYDYYMDMRATRYCNTDFDCRLSEYCLCQNGNYNGSFCPTEKKRCMPMAEYNDIVQRKLTDSDIVNQRCLDYGINKYKKYWGTKTIPYGDIEKISTYCSKKEFINEFPQDLSLDYYYKVDNTNPKFKGDGFKISEHFNGNTKTYFVYIILFFIVVCFAGYLCGKKIDI